MGSLVIGLHEGAPPLSRKTGGAVSVGITAETQGLTRSAGRYHRGMLLVLDIGNTNMTLGLVAGEAIVASRRAATRPSATPDELEILIDGLLRLDGASLADVTGISLASVVPTLTGAAEAIAERRGLPLLSADRRDHADPRPRPSGRPRSARTGW